MHKKINKKQIKTFADKVRDVVRKIPRGKTLTYAQVASRAGSPKASRAVGSIMAGNFDPKIPCHRVIRSDGGIGQYNRGGPKAKRAILKRESVVI